MDVFDIIEKIITSLYRFAAAVIQFAIFLVLSVFVVPAMLIMLHLHKIWEKQLEKLFDLNPF